MTDITAPPTPIQPPAPSCWNPLTTTPVRSRASRQVSDSSTKKSAMKNQYPPQNSASKTTIASQYAAIACARHSQPTHTSQPARCNSSRAASKNHSIPLRSQVPRINRRLLPESNAPAQCPTAVLPRYYAVVPTAGTMTIAPGPRAQSTASRTA